MKSLGITLILLALFPAGAIVPLAATPPPESRKAAPTMDEANALFQAQQWDQAAADYEAIVGSEPGNGPAWLRLGNSRHSLKQYDKAIAAYEKAVALGAGLPGGRYNLACAYALNGDKEKAFAWLDKALAAGFRNVAQLRNDPDLASLRDDPRFEKAVALAGKASQPCKSDEVHGQLDFWVGEWEVTNPKGQKAGTNSIVKTLDGCLILENWTGTEGSIGKSMNYFDPVTKKWAQTWVDNSGDVIAYEGELRNGAMLLQGTHREKAGTTVRSRMSLTPQPNGHVRQVIEESRDGGKTWSVWFAGDYAPKK